MHTHLVSWNEFQQLGAELEEGRVPVQAVLFPLGAELGQHRLDRRRHALLLACARELVSIVCWTVDIILSVFLVIIHAFLSSRCVVIVFDSAHHLLHSIAHGHSSAVLMPYTVTLSTSACIRTSLTPVLAKQTIWMGQQIQTCV